MKNLNKLLILLLAVSLNVSLIACSTNSANFDETPKIRIPNLPPNVKYTEPKLPNKEIEGPKETADVLREYESANEKNKNAINAARSHINKLQRMYNTEK